jgi:hypothetical protein
MTVYVASCSHCEWKIQKNETPTDGESELCPCCSESFVPQWKSETQDDPPPAKAPSSLHEHSSPASQRIETHARTQPAAIHASLSSATRSLTFTTPPPIQVVVKDFDMSFGSMVGFMVKWALAAIPAALIFIIIIGIFIVIFSALLGLSVSK